MSIATRKGLVEAVRTRYEHANCAEKARIMDEFTSVAGDHRKHAIRALNSKVRQGKPERQRSRFVCMAGFYSLANASNCAACSTKSSLTASGLSPAA